jgi:hypothetical protein
MNLSQIFKEAILEAKKEKPSAGLTKKQKSDVAKKAKAGGDIGKKGKGFEKIAKKAGGGEKGKKIAAAAMWKNIKRVKEGSDGMDHEVSMAKNSLESIAKSVMELMQKLGNEERDIPGWIQDHISNAENFIDQAAQGFHELGGHDEEEEDDEDSEESEMIQPVDEKKLTKAEKAKKEEIIKSMAKKGGGKEKMGPKQYAIATAQAIKSAE